MKSQKQSGFTLIELMIVVTIIGILASIAVPAYRDYTIRTRVGERASLFGIIKTESSIYYSENGTLPVDLLALSTMGRITNDPAAFTGDYVSQMFVGNTSLGSVECQLQDIPELGDPAPVGARNGQLVYIPTTTGNTINWDIQGNIPTKFWPSPF
jgi:type IV pilus assembly protein PilA